MSGIVTKDIFSNLSASYGVDNLEKKLILIASKKNVPVEIAKLASHTFAKILVENLAKGVLMSESLKFAENGFNSLIMTKETQTSVYQAKNVLANSGNVNKLTENLKFNDSTDYNRWSLFVSNQLKEEITLSRR
jgi:prophage DNA circulation protein